MLIVVNVVSYVIFDDLLGALCNQEKLLYWVGNYSMNPLLLLKFKYSVAFDDLEDPPKPRRDQYGICYRGVI